MLQTFNFSKRSSCAPGDGWRRALRGRAVRGETVASARGTLQNQTPLVLRTESMRSVLDALKLWYLHFGKVPAAFHYECGGAVLGRTPAPIDFSSRCRRPQPGTGHQRDVSECLSFSRNEMNLPHYPRGPTGGHSGREIGHRTRPAPDVTSSQRK